MIGESSPGETLRPSRCADASRRLQHSRIRPIAVRTTRPPPKRDGLHLRSSMIADQPVPTNEERVLALLRTLAKQRLDVDLDSEVAARSYEFWALGVDSKKRRFRDLIGNIDGGSMAIINSKFQDADAGFKAKADKVLGLHRRADIVPPERGPPFKKRRRADSSPRARALSLHRANRQGEGEVYSGGQAQRRRDPGVVPRPSEGAPHGDVVEDDGPRGEARR